MKFQLNSLRSKAQDANQETIQHLDSLGEGSHARGGDRVNSLKRRNIFDQEEEDDQEKMKKPIMRDPRKSKWMAAFKMADSGESQVHPQVHQPSVDKESNTLMIENIPSNFTALMICEIFSIYGAIYSCRVLTDKNIAYVAFTISVNAKIAMEKLDQNVFDGSIIKISYAPKLMCSGEILIEAAENTEPSGLLFNAQILNSSEGPSPSNQRVIVKIPSDMQLCKIIHQTVERVLKYGTNFEMKLINLQKDNSQFKFLTDFNSGDHAYYRWKVYSLKNGDLIYWWRLQPFFMFENQSVWIPPKIPFQENAFDIDHSIDYDSSASESGDSDDEGDKVRYPSKPAQMSFYHRQCLESKLRALTTYRGDIAEAMIFCIRHASYAAEEITDMICQSLLLNETVIYPTKIARLYLISDILFNASSKPNAWKYRTVFETHLPEIFSSFGNIGKTVPGLMRQEKFRVLITSTITAWERWGIFPSHYTQKLRLCYKSGCKDGRTFETRLNDQQSNKIGLYSTEYELLVPNFATKMDTEEACNEDLPVGFKRVDSWVDVPETLDDSENGKSQFTLKIQKQPHVYEGDYDVHHHYPIPEQHDNAYVARTGDQNPDGSDEDIDGVPLSRDLFSKRIDEESKEDIDGMPLNTPLVSDEDLDGNPLNNSLDSEEEDIDGMPLNLNDKII